MRCPRCNSENPPEYRFCGMCGTPLDQASEGAARSNEPVAVTDRPRRSEPAPPPSQSLSGPSFLGLGSEPARPSEDVTYLFEEEQPKRTYWRFILLLLVLGAVGGLFWLQYTRSGKSWVAPWAHQQPATPEQASQQPPPPAAAQTPAPQNSASANTPANSQQPTLTPGNPPPPKETDLTPGGTQPAESATTPTSNTTPANQEAGTATPSQGPAPANSESAAKEATAAPESKTAKNEGAANDEADTAEAAPTKTKPSRVKPTPAEPAAPAANPDDALVGNAEKYLYGRGVPQNCDRALVSLRAAADRQNVRARALLGTMYATGHCVPRDLPNAYRWFAQASRQETDNMWIQRNLEMIWREMTPQERQLAMQR